MSIILSLIAKYPDVVLCEYSEFVGNFPQITRVVLQKLKPNCKYSIEYDKHKYYYINENKITYLCLSDGISDEAAFSFLNELKKNLLQNYEIEKVLSLNANQLKGFVDDMKCLMNFYNTNPYKNKAGEVISQLNATKDIIVESIDKLIERDQRINMIATKSETISKVSQNINSFAVSIKKEEERKRNQTIMMVAGGVVVLLFLLYSIF